MIDDQYDLHMTWHLFLGFFWFLFGYDTYMSTTLNTVCNKSQQIPLLRDYRFLGVISINISSPDTQLAKYDFPHIYYGSTINTHGIIVSLSTL